MSIASAVEGGKRLMAATFLDRCALLDIAFVSDGAGGTTEVLTPRATFVPCVFGRLNETDIRIIAGWTQGPATGVVTVPLDVDVPEGTYVQNVSGDDSFWVVVGDRTPASNMAVARRLLIREASWGVS